MAGAVVLILSAFSAWYFFLEPLGTLAFKDVSTAGALTGFLLAGGFMLPVVATLRETIRRLKISKAVRETLFRELQHRVANNLQLVVTSLRSAQRSLRNSEAAAETISEAENRIMAMSQLHRCLLDGTAYADGFEPLLSIYVKGEFDLSIDQMTALTLLVNEAALNAVKHVFSKGKGTLFNVSMCKDENGNARLLIEDDGPGIGTQVTNKETRSLGMGIMQAFATQLGGSLKVAPAAGTSLMVEFTTGSRH